MPCWELFDRQDPAYRAERAGRRRRASRSRPPRPSAGPATSPARTTFVGMTRLRRQRPRRAAVRAFRHHGRGGRAQGGATLARLNAATRGDEHGDREARDQRLWPHRPQRAAGAGRARPRATSRSWPSTICPASDQRAPVPLRQRARPLPRRGQARGRQCIDVGTRRRSRCWPSATWRSCPGASSASTSCSNARASSPASDKAAGHLGAGAKRVLVSAPADGADLTVVYGVNHDQLQAPSTRWSPTPPAPPTAWRRWPRC